MKKKNFLFPLILVVGLLSWWYWAPAFRKPMEVQVTVLNAAGQPVSGAAIHTRCHQSYAFPIPFGPEWNVTRGEKVEITDVKGQASIRFSWQAMELEQVTVRNRPAQILNVSYQLTDGTLQDNGTELKLYYNPSWTSPQSPDPYQRRCVVRVK